MAYFPSTALSDARTLAAYCIFLASYVVFALGKFPGLKIDRTGAAIVGAVGMVAFRIVRTQDALRFIDFQTVVLLFSMMLIVGNLHLVGFFEWNAEAVLRRLKPQHLLPAVIFTCGLLSAFFVNDIVCLVMVPFVLSITRRMKLQPLPYLLAVATAFLLHLGPVAVIGLFIDWGVLHWVHMRNAPVGPDRKDEIPLPELDLSKLTKPVIVAAAVVVGFFLGVDPPLMAALGAALLLITRTLEPQKLYKEVDWGLLVFFVGLFLIVGGAETAGITNKLLEVAHHWNLQNMGVFTITVAALCNVVNNVPAVMLLKALVPGFANPRTAWMVLAMASTLAGNLTITGSVANIIVVETAKPEIEIRFQDYLKAGVPITLMTLLVGWAWLELASSF
jgi:Na+/H+ antiporter NhaD/arsenite permease-like protein